MTTDETTPHAFRVRLWRAKPTQHGQATRVSVTDPVHRQHFASRDARAAYLLAPDQPHVAATETLRQPQSNHP